MKIRPLVDCSCVYVDIHTRVSEAFGLFRQVSYLAVTDENRQVAGVVTVDDLYRHPLGTIVDCDLKKQRISPDWTLLKVLDIMRKTGHFYLPVFEGDKFMGVISLLSITFAMADQVRDGRVQYQKVIHDIRNPIANIKGLTGALGMNGNSAEDHHMRQLILGSCQQATDILDDLMNIEYFEAERFIIREVEMNAFYQQCVREQKGLASSKNITFSEDYSPLKVVRKIDEPRLKRAIYNIISNAVKFSYPFSTINISTKTEGDRFVLKIIDHGVGIAADAQPFIFDKFSTAQRLGTIGEFSTGLGLYFTKQCIEDHNGEITFSSSEGKGTRFDISL